MAAVIPGAARGTVLGLWDGHDAGVAIAHDGRLVCALSEERISRRKRASGFPYRSLEAALRWCGLDLRDVDVVAVPGRWGRLGHRLADPLYRLASGDHDPLSRSSTLVRQLECGVARLPGLRGLESHAGRAVLAARLLRLGCRATLVPVEHHEAHAWTARLCAAPGSVIVTMDGYGDGLAGTISSPDGGREELLAPRDSVALVYGAVTRVLGFGEGDEGKVMGLAAAGNPEPLRPFFRQVLAPGACDPRLGGRLGRARLQEHSRADVAAALQERTEEVVLEMLSGVLASRAPLALAGGLFANVSLSGRLARHGMGVQVFPHMGDGGLCVGALAAVLRGVDWGMPFLGPVYDELRMEQALVGAGLRVERTEDPEGSLLRAILDGLLVARFVGRSEFGPRALGHRSILLRADRPELATELGRRLERDETMPFAPVRRGGEGSSTMTLCVDADQELRERCPAAVHLDGTVRTQRVDAHSDPGLWSLLERAEAAGLPALINTSFNLHGEPIVETPEDAVRSFVAAGLDLLQMGPFVARRFH